SATNGQNGASSLEIVKRHSRNVANAAGSPSQKRLRERRTYQLERSSTNSAVADVRDRAQRSRASLAVEAELPLPGAPRRVAWAGSAPSRSPPSPPRREPAFAFA